MQQIQGIVQANRGANIRRSVLLSRGMKAGSGVPERQSNNQVNAYSNQNDQAQEQTGAMQQQSSTSIVKAAQNLNNPTKDPQR